MTFYAVSEPQFETSNWYKSILNGLVSEIRQKRLNIVFLYSMMEVENCTPEDDDVIFVIGTDTGWIKSTVPLCEKNFDNRVIVLGTGHQPSDENKHSIIMTDIARHIFMLYTYLKNHGKKRIAMYGINPDSVPDNLKKRSFINCGGNDYDIFENDETLEKCFEKFSRKRDLYDGVICVNSYAAISLIRHLGEDYKNFFITSCSGTSLTEVFRPSVTCTKTNYLSFGKAGVSLARALVKNRNIASQTIKLSAEFYIGETTDFLPYKNINIPQQIPPEKESDRFYEDPEINEMINLEILLDSCNNEEIAIIHKLLSGKKYSEIASEHYISENTVKYKLKNMYRVCHVRTKREFMHLLEKYIKQ